VEEIITPSQVAELLQVHVRTVYRLAEKGQFPEIKSGVAGASGKAKF